MFSSSRHRPDTTAVRRLMRLFAIDDDPPADSASSPDQPSPPTDRAADASRRPDRPAEPPAPSPVPIPAPAPASEPAWEPQPMAVPSVDAGPPPAPSAAAAGHGADRPAVLREAAARLAPRHSRSSTAARPEADTRKRSSRAAESASGRAVPRVTKVVDEPSHAAPTGTSGRAQTTETTETADEPPTGGAPREKLGEQLMATFGMRQARLDPGTNGTRALAALAVLVVIVAAGIAWWSQPRPEQVAAPRATAPAAVTSAGATGVVVAVAGKVRRPGLVTLAPGARVADAIKAAGGVLPGTDVGYLNLARKVTDGELIVVGENPPSGAAPGAPGGAPGSGDTAKVNLNTATLQQLDTLPGVGMVLAQRIIDYREDHGGFRSVDDLRQVDGIGPARYEQLKDLVTV